MRLLSFEIERLNGHQHQTRTKISTEQECILVGCVATAAVDTGKGGLHSGTSLPHTQRPPLHTEIPPWTDLPY